MRPASKPLVIASLLGFVLLAPALSAAAKGPKGPPAPVRCTDLAGPNSDLLGTPGVKSAESHTVGVVGQNLAYCQVNILYGTNPDQNINIRVGLPINSVDGGTGGVEGAWNGRTQGIGGGGCAGSLGVTGPVNAGYVGSGSDAGHSGGNCEPGVNLDGTYNLQFINDFIRNGMTQQILLSKDVTNTYYAMKPAYNYWNGCSTGGRQGYVLAQELSKELDGIPDRADVGANRDAGSRRGPDRCGQTQPSHRLGRCVLRRGRRCHRRRDRRSAHMHVQRDGKRLRDTWRSGDQLPDIRRSAGYRQDLGRAAKR